MMNGIPSFQCIVQTFIEIKFKAESRGKPEPAFQKLLQKPIVQICLDSKDKRDVAPTEGTLCTEFNKYLSKFLYRCFANAILPSGTRSELQKTLALPIKIYGSAPEFEKQNKKEIYWGKEREPQGFGTFPPPPLWSLKKDLFSDLIQGTELFIVSKVVLLCPLLWNELKCKEQNQISAAEVYSNTGII